MNSEFAGLTTMVDFNKLIQDRKEAGKKLLEEVKDKPTVLKEQKPTHWNRLQHLVQHHLGEMTAWEEQFCYSNIEFLSKVTDPDKREYHAQMYFSGKVKNKIKELEDTYCGQVCHALMQANIPHV